MALTGRMRAVLGSVSHSLAHLCAAAIFLGTISMPVSARAEGPSVVASVKPLHSLVAGVMAGIGEPGLVVDGAASPHSFSLSPSSARMLGEADLIFWIGPQLETFLERPLSNLAGAAEVVRLIDAKGITLIQPEGFSHARNGAAGEIGPDQAADAHIWLDPGNAAAMVETISTALARIDPENAADYRRNADMMRADLLALTNETQTKLGPVRGRPFIVFHDAYRYFEQRFDLASAGALTVNPEVMPGAARLAALRAKVEAAGAVCVFTEPQFNDRLVDVLIAGTPVRKAALDPLGAALEPGPGLYFRLLRGMTEAFQHCLSEG